MDPFALLHIEPEFALNLDLLEEHYLQAQRLMHPDFWTSSLNKTVAGTLSAQLNEAYQTLLNPLKRAEVLIKQKQWWPLQSFPEVLEENFILQEAREAGRLALEHVVILQTQAAQAFHQAWSTNMAQSAQHAYLRMTYLHTLWQKFPKKEGQALKP